MTDGAPARALGVDPADARLMSLPPRPRSEGVLTPRMWRGILFVGAVTAVGTLLVLDASLPGGLIEGQGTMAYAQTMALTTLVFFSLFTLFMMSLETSRRVWQARVRSQRPNSKPLGQAMRSRPLRPPPVARQRQPRHHGR